MSSYDPKRPSDLRTRRRFIVGTALLFVAARTAAQSRVHRIGLIGQTEALNRTRLPALLAGLERLGYREGQNLLVERRYIDDKPDQLPALAMELINLGVEVVVADGELPAQAVKAAKPSMPIVMTWSLDPVGNGLAASLARPGGSVTGLTWDVGPEQVSRRLQLFKEVVPSITRIGLIWDPTVPGVDAYWPPVNAASRALGIQIHSLEVRTQRDVTAALEGLRKNRPGALFIFGGPVTWTHLKQITDFAIRERLPAFAATTRQV